MTWVECPGFRVTLGELCRDQGLGRGRGASQRTLDTKLRILYPVGSLPKFY